MTAVALKTETALMLDTMSDDDILRVFEYASSLMQNQKMSQKKERPFGVAKGKFVCPDDIDFCNDEIAEMFSVNE